MIRDLPPPALPDSLHSILAGAGYGPPPTEEPVVPDPPFPAEALAMARSEPVLAETPATELSPEPLLGDAAECEPEPGPEPALLDSERGAEPDSDQRPKPSAAVRRRGPVASFAVHAVALLAFFDWPAITPIEMTQPIPVALVVEQPQTEKAQDKAQSPPQPEGHLASEDFGDPNVKESGAGAPAPAEAAKPDPAPPETKDLVPPPPPKPPDRIAMAVPPPPPKPTPPAARPQPKPAAAAAAPPHPQETPNRAAHAARYPGPSATRDEYLAYLLALTKQHFDLLPISAVGDRHGETVVAVLVLDDGTIARVGVAQSSGYPDIDRRVEEMVAAVGHFPPLPQWYQAPRVELNLRLRFPEALAE